MKKKDFDSYKNMVKDAFARYDAAMQESAAMFEKSKQRDKYAAAYIEKLQVDALQKERDARKMLINSKRELSKLAAQQREAVKRSVALDGSQLTPDAALLTGGYRLTKDDYLAIIERNQGNTTMARLILDRAEKDGIRLPVRFAGLDGLEEIDTVMDVCSLVVDRKAQGIDEFDAQLGDRSLFAGLYTE